MQASEALFLIVMFTGFFACVFGIFYLKTRQNLAMIEKGMNPKQFANRPAPYKNLKWALLIMGAGAGLLVAYIFDFHVLPQRDYNAHGENAPIYFALIAIGGGLGLLGSYKMEKKWWDENKDKE